MIKLKNTFSNTKNTFLNNIRDFLNQSLLRQLGRTIVLMLRMSLVQQRRIEQLVSSQYIL